MSEIYQYVPLETKETARVRIIYDSGKVQDWTLGLLLEQKDALIQRIAAGEKLQSDLDALNLRINGVSSVVATLPVDPPPVDTP